jgi:serine phosphatase RsbU (regulator of sigma subunit)
LSDTLDFFIMQPCRAYLWIITGLLSLVLSTGKGYAQTSTYDTALHLSLAKLQEGAFEIPSHYWRYSKLDVAPWERSQGLDQWQSINPRLWLDSLPQEAFSGLGWFQVQFIIDSSLFHHTIALMLFQRGAGEIYLNGRLIETIGEVSTNPDKERKYNPFGDPIALKFGGRPLQTLSVRYSNSNAWQLYNNYGRFARTAGFRVVLGDMTKSVRKHVTDKTNYAFKNVSQFGILMALGLLHLCLFFFYPRQQANLFYGLFSVGVGLTFYIEYVHRQAHQIDYVIYLNMTNLALMFVLPLLLMRVFYTIFSRHLPLNYYILVGAAILASLTAFDEKLNSTLMEAYYGLAILEVIRATVMAIVQKQRLAWFISGGVIVGMLFLLIYAASLGLIAAPVIPEWTRTFIRYTGVLAISSVMSIFLASNFAYTNRLLSMQIVQIQELSDKTLAQEKEKQELLATQNERLEAEVKARTAEIEQQKDEILEKNLELEQQNEYILDQQKALQLKTAEVEAAYNKITDSIRYAQRIQEAVLGEIDQIEQHYKEAFVLFRPKDIVSGDFYWAAEHTHDQRHYQIIAAVDCTGHGVPGAFMTLIGNDFLSDIVNKDGILHPDEILLQLNNRVTERLNKGQTHLIERRRVNDGMDMALCMWDKTANRLYFAGAKNPLIFIRNGELHTIRGAKFSIGGVDLNTEDKYYDCHTIIPQPDDAFYIFSDGYQDQFGEITDRKYMTKRLRELLLSLHHLPMREQKAYLEHEFEQWKGNKEQTDDVLMIGFRLR